MQTTRWIDRETLDLESAISLLTDEVVDDPVGDGVSWQNWSFTKAGGNNFVEKFNGRDIEFNVIKYTVDQITAGPLPLEDRTVPKEGFVIVYNNGVNVNYITDRNSGAKTFLRKILSYKGSSEIEKNMHELSSDFFIWLIYKVYNSENTIESGRDSTPDIHLDVIKGFRGDTEDLLTTVSATGESVMNIISTLSFLLESSNLNQIKLDLGRASHANISLLLKRGGVITADIDQYRGPFEAAEQQVKMAKIYLLVYLEIIPSMIQAYESDRIDDLWNDEVYTGFLSTVAKDISTRIQQKINDRNPQE